MYFLSLSVVLPISPVALRVTHMPNTCASNSYERTRSAWS